MGSDSRRYGKRCPLQSDLQTVGREKQPYYIHPTDRAVFAFAGVWERWTREGAYPLNSFAILTTTPNVVMAPIHDRMPVIPAPEACGAWLGETIASAEALRALLTHCAPESVAAYPVTRYVNAPGDEGPSCVAALAV